MPQIEYSRTSIPGTHLPTLGDGQLSWLAATCVSSSDDWVRTRDLPRQPYLVETIHLKYSGRDGIREIAKTLFSSWFLVKESIQIQTESKDIERSVTLTSFHLRSMRNDNVAVSAHYRVVSTGKSLRTVVF